MARLRFAKETSVTSCRHAAPPLSAAMDNRRDECFVVRDKTGQQSENWLEKREFN